jgi:ribosome recycling factor
MFFMPVDDILLEAEMHMEKAIDHLHHELRGIRTGRATPALVENIKVDYYGSPTDLRSIASISVPETTQLLIKPFSPSDLKAIEKAINDSKIGLTPHSDGKSLRLMLPPMSQERRLQLAGQCKQFAETSKVAIRNARRDANKAIETEEKAGDVTEDEATQGKEKIQDLTKSYEAKVDEIIEKKRAEVMAV